MSRSKSGCITCRIRRVKCDERKPHCQRCCNSKRSCDGYLPPEKFMTRRDLAEAVRKLSVTGPVTRALSQIPSPTDPRVMEAEPSDTAFFDLFRRATVPGTCNTMPNSFWQRDVMQLAHSEPALWHATVALGKLHRKAEEEVLGVRTASQAIGSQAAKHYIQAMALAKDLDSLPKYVILSIVLSATASMLSRWGDMHAHVLSGLRMIVADRSGRESVKMLGAALLRMDLQAMTAYRDAAQPYPFDKSRTIFGVEPFLLTPCVPGVSFEKLASDLSAISRAFFQLDDGVLSGSVPYGPWLTKVEGVMRRLTAWEGRIAEFEASHHPSPGDEQARLSLRLFHVLIRALADAGPPGAETRFDRLLGHSEYAVRLAASVLALMRRGSVFLGVSLELGIILPLQAIAHRCRHHSLRHAALKILAEANRVEAMWRSDAVLQVQRAIVAAEESMCPVVSAPVYTPKLLDASSLDIPWSDWAQSGFSPATTLHWRDQPVIPEEMRVKEVLAKTQLDKRCVNLTLVMCSADKETNGRVREIRVTY